MNRKVLVVFVASMALAMLATPLVSAVPPKVTWHYVKSLNFINDVIINAQREYYPSFEKPNRMVITATENYLSFVITVDGHTYTMGEDFNVVSQVTMTFNNPTFTSPAQYYPATYKTTLTTVELSFDFSAYSGGLEGTLQLIEIGNQGLKNTFSVGGTGDFQDVAVKGVWASAYAAPILTVTEDGTVIGWPE